MGKLVVIHRNSKCSFCKTSKNDYLKYGPMYKLGDLKAHYYCLLLSNRLIQNGDDNEGILGFLLTDIEKELKRTSNILCVYCKKGNATIKCAKRKCKKSFHLPCGIKGGTLHQFSDEFKSFCHMHRPSQCIPPKVLKEAYETNIICCICYEPVDVKHRINNLWAPCCIRTWYHRLCVQKLAHSAGYFFRCAACNDAEKFNKWMQKFGIFIPQHDASWELVPNAFEELLHRHDKCDAEKCKCPEGRQKNEDNTIWEIILCESCGSQGIHIACGGLKFLDPEWECPSCQKVTENMKLASNSVYESQIPVESSSNSLTEVCQRKRKRDSEDLRNSVLDKRKKLSCEEKKAEDVEEIDIDVETVVEELKNTADEGDLLEEDDDSILSVEVVKVNGKESTKLDEALSELKPGPLSYKLSLIGKVSQALSAAKKTTKNSIDIIELSDSDGNGDEDEEKKDDSELELINVNSECDSEDSFTVITPDEVREESEERDEDENEIENASEKLSFSFTLHSNKWEMDDDVCLINENPPNLTFKKKDIPQNISSPSSKSKSTCQCSIGRETVQDCKSEFREEKDFRTDPGDEVIILTE